MVLLVDLLTNKVFSKLINFIRRFQNKTFLNRGIEWELPGSKSIFLRHFL